MCRNIYNIVTTIVLLCTTSQIAIAKNKVKHKKCLDSKIQKDCKDLAIKDKDGFLWSIPKGYSSDSAIAVYDSAFIAQFMKNDPRSKVVSLRLLPNKQNDNKRIAIKSEGIKGK